jgi:hypothetical protein
MVESRSSNHTKFVLLDANIVAGYYLPESLDWIRAKDRITNIIDAVRKHGAPEICIYIPEPCIAEVRAVFDRYRFATWDRKVRKKLPHRIDGKRYEKIQNQFMADLHTGPLLQSVPLNMYHISAAKLISSVDANYEYYRHRKNSKKMQKKMMGAADHTIIGIGIYLSRIHRRDNFAILTADHRLADILTRAISISRRAIKKLGLDNSAQELGIEFKPHIYPRVINLAKASKKELQDFFGLWPLPVKPVVKESITKLNLKDCRILAKLRQKSRVPRDRLPYTESFEKICREFERIKGQVVDRNTAWSGILRIEKKGTKRKSI